MWRRRKDQIAEIDVKLKLLDAKLAAVDAATARLGRTAIAAGTTEKVLKASIERAEAMNTKLKRTTQGR